MVTVVSGAIFDVVVDLRPDSPTCGEYACFNLSAEGAEKPNQIFIPEGLAHGFATHQGSAKVVYQVSRPWSPKYEKVIRWNDERYAIPWPVKDPTLSEKDQAS